VIQPLKLSQAVADARTKIFLGIALCFCSVALPGEDLPPPSSAGLRHFVRVDDHLYRGGQPQLKGLETASKLGIRTVVDLRGAGERADAEKQKAVELGMKYYSIPLHNNSAPTNEQMAEILSVIENKNNWPVFVHCRRGKDRTGTVVACYRIEHDHWTNQQALAEARELGLSRTELGMRNFILRYRLVAQPAALTEGTH
jgi:tyrosine-protein phosphatase SIW14